MEIRVDFMVFEIQFFRLEAARRAYLNKQMERTMLVSWFLLGCKNARPQYALLLIWVVKLTLENNIFSIDYVLYQPKYKIINLRFFQVIIYLIPIKERGNNCFYQGIYGLNCCYL